MKQLLWVGLLFLFLTSCGTSKKKYDSKIVLNTSERSIPKTPKKTNLKSKKVKTSNSTRPSSEENIDSRIHNIIDVAHSYHGTPYHFGGTTSKGMDCSGLIYTAFKEENITLPRISRDMATKGKKISLSKVTKGDLVFFKTNPRRNTINHVGLVVDVFPGKILFIHSSTSQGVIISALDETYWNKAFVEARRVIEI